ncbi:hypothetical protein [Pseudogracilibacillus sp. ICA-222130]|uniref:hypothetical protein n=1 Tax=Pseudogracilibacillus sp. ICA-222130 TaxID=3134655 RepID=UPI0030C0EB44
MSELKYYVRHQQNYLRDKLLLICKDEATKDFFQRQIPGSRFERLTRDQAEHVSRIGMHGKIVTFGYTYKLTEEEMNQISTLDFDRTAAIIAEGNARLYKEAIEKGLER